MESKVNYTIVGIFVLLLIAAIVIFTVWLSAGFNKQNYKTYIVYMNESVSGLVLDSPVRYNGVVVGQVSDIALNLKNPQQVILTLQIQPNIPITETTYATLMEQGITGIEFIGLQTGEPAPLLQAKKGEKYPVIPSQPSFLVRLDQFTQDVSTNLSKVGNSIQKLLNKKAIQNIQKTLVNLQKITATISTNSKNISTMMANTALASKKLPTIMNSINRGVLAIQALSAELSTTANSINQTTVQSNVAIQSFSNDILPETYSTLKQIKQATKNISGLSDELKQNPAMIIKGKAQARPGPGE